YNIERQLREAFPDLELCSILGSTSDPILVEDAMRTHSPNLVLHTAAYKHVPLLENQARVAVKNNLLGTKTVADLSDQYGCDVFALISTDKAVNPTNLLGATKRVAEIYCQSLDARSKTRFVTVRFGNVLDSAGSVVPLFRSQIRAGGPVHVTHPEITRYFMTIPEACQLILQATSMGQGGEIFVLDMGEPIKIRDLAEEMIRLSGKTPGEDIEIVYSGLRPGEKLHEEMFYELETPIGTSSEKILLVRNREVNYPRLQEAMANFEARCQANDIEGLISELAALVPEYTVRSAEAGKDSNVLPLVKKTAR
ncbi:MAG: polysaccharide biosynthesis protein, partial [SAR324 cluster bacterium]|nr:polysaccharide biosynthesis protein [SAR324 cluster bacterium]